MRVPWIRSLAIMMARYQKGAYWSHAVQLSPYFPVSTATSQANTHAKIAQQLTRGEGHFGSKESDYCPDFGTTPLAEKRRLHVVLKYTQSAPQVAVVCIRALDMSDSKMSHHAQRIRQYSPQAPINCCLGSDYGLSRSWRIAS